MERVPLDVAQRQQEQQTASAPIAALNPTAWQGQAIPYRKWLVPGLIPWRSVTLLTGDGGLGKSLLMLMLQAACALGRPWLNHDVVPVKSLGLYAEDEEDELHRRLNDIRLHYEAEFSELEKMCLAPRVGENNLLRLPGGPDGFTHTPLYEGLLRRCQQLGAQLVVLDTVADIFGGNENNRAEVRSFISLLRKLAISIDGVVVLSAHPSQSGLSSGSGMSGSTAWNNSVRSRLYLTRVSDRIEAAQQDTNDRILRPMKSNYSSVENEMLIRWVDGVFVTPECDGGTLRTIENGKVEQVFLEGVDKAAVQGRALSEYKTATNYAPKAISKMPHAKGNSMRAL